VLGNDLATSSQADALMDAARGGGDGPKPFVYALRGKRLVWASESNEGRRINEGLVKQLTGGDRLNVRTLHSKPVEFKPTHLLLMITNHKPHINADGSAIWERVLLIPFCQRFVDSPQGGIEHKRDPFLKEKLRAELPGILAWLVMGCMEWQEGGIKPPPAVSAATAEYREDEDTIALFLDEKVTIRENSHVKASELYKAYSDWCKEFNFMAMSLTAFSTRMKGRFKWQHTKTGNYFDGLTLEKQIPF
jgi:putative DNA primase/helicase